MIFKARVGFRKKIFVFSARSYLKIAGVLKIFRQIRFGHNFLSAGTKALFIIVFLFGINILGAKAAESTIFLIDPSYDITSRASTGATNIVNGVNAYFYADDNYWMNLTSAEQGAVLASVNDLAQEFDSAIYPKMKAAYGDEWNPGIDNDPRIYILLTNIVKDAGGYFNPNDEYFKIQVKDNRSNEKEIIYLNADFIGKPSLKSFLAHEFQHMINWYQKKKISGVDEEVWLNEGLSEYSSTLLGYDIPYQGSVIGLRTNNFLQHTSDSLTEWQNMNQDYATVNLFMQFLVDHYGKSILKEIVISSQTGIAAINDSLRILGFRADFNEVFSDWEIANYLNDKETDNGKYAYQNPVLDFSVFHIKPTETFTVQSASPITNIEYTKDWSGRWYQFTSPLTGGIERRALKIIFSADDTASDFRIPYIIKYVDGTAVIGSIKLNLSQTGTAFFDDFNTKIALVVILPISEKKIAGFTQSEPLVKFSYTMSLVEMNAPVISNISPASSSVNGGALAVISGENFNANSIVKFGGIAAEIESADSKMIIARIPPSLKSGNVSVEVSNSPSLSSIASQPFTYFSLPEDGSLIRAEGDYKVYVVNGKYKRWIQSAEIFKFYPHFGWKAVITVSPGIRDYYSNSFLVRADGDYKVYEINADNSKHHLAITAEQFAASGRQWDMVYIINKAERDFYRTGAIITR